ncbi:MAG: NAD(P)-dependent oxidoreductase [bacterium]|nr:NAD(P)-dependent oxidoreductase [bacterium]
METLNKPTVLITGSEGNIGRVLRVTLADQYDVYTLDQAGLASETHQVVDLSDYKAMQTAFVNIPSLDYVVHLGADPREDAPWKSVLKNNVVGTKNLYECAFAKGVKKVIFASSTHVIGGYPGYPQGIELENGKKLTVNDPLKPDGYYGVSKGFGELLARQYYDMHDLSSICIRIGTITHVDDPHHEERREPYIKLWISHRDITQLVKLSLQHENVPFGIYWGISNNTGAYLNISNAERELGYKPQDNAFSYPKPK